MSNSLAIASVTETLRQILLATIEHSSPDNLGGLEVEVKTVRPTAAGTGMPLKGVNVYLYQITPNAALRNADLPTRSSGGQTMARPQVAVDLHYMLSFFGDDTFYEPQRLFGIVARVLHARPVLSRDEIQAVMTNAGASNGFGFFKSSDLADYVERIRFSPVPLSLDDLSKIWSTFYYQMPYTLSAAYQASPILLDADDVPQPALPVRSRGIYVSTFAQPVIDQVAPAAASDQPIVAGTVLAVSGKNLRSDNTQVLIDGVTFAPSDVRDDQVTLTLPNLLAGVHGLQVAQPRYMGSPPTPHPGVESIVAAFVLHPVITTVADSNVASTTSGTTTLYSATVTVTLDLAVGGSQRVVLLLNQVPPASPPAAYAFSAPLRSTSSTSVDVPIAGVVAGTYLVRVQVDGAESVVLAGGSGAQLQVGP